MKQRTKKPAVKAEAPKPQPEMKLDDVDLVEDIAMDTLAPAATGEIGIWTRRVVRLLRTLESCNECAGYLATLPPAHTVDPVPAKLLAESVQTALDRCEKILTSLAAYAEPVSESTPTIPTDLDNDRDEVQAALMAVLDDPTTVSHLARVLDEFGNVLPRPLVFRVLLNNWDNTDITEKDSELMMATEVNFTNRE